MSHIPFYSLETLRGRNLQVVGLENIPHPIRAIVSSLGSFRGDLERVISEIPILPPMDSEEGRDCADHFRNLCYRAAEIFEIYEKLTQSFPSASRRSSKESVKVYKATIKRNGKDWKFICNNIKHNGNIISPVQVRYKSGLFTSGFMLIQPQGDKTFVINNNFHKDKGRSVSYSLAVRKMLHDISSADSALSTLISGLPDDSGLEISIPNSTELFSAEIWKKVTRIPLVAFPSERGKVYDLDTSKYPIEWRVINLQAPKEVGRYRVSYRGDGMTTSYPIP